VGLGRESHVPPGPRLGLLDVSRPSASDGHTWIPAEEKWRRRPTRTLGFICASSRYVALHSSPHDGATAGRLAGARAAIKRLIGRAIPAHRVDLGDAGRRAMRRRMAPPRALSPTRVPADGGRAAVERLLGGALPMLPWRVLSLQPRAAARDLPTRRVDPSTASGSGHEIFTKGESRNLLLLHLKNLRSSPSNFYPDLDPRT
jgi:hypothetical protein